MNPLFWITTLVLVTALIYDIRFGRIPNWLTFPAMITGLAYHAYVSGMHGFLLGCGGLIVGFCIFITFYLLGGMGAGDVKLMAAIGALLGPTEAFLCAVLTAIAGGIYSAVLILVHDFNRATFVRYGVMAKVLFHTCRFRYIPSEKEIPSLRYGIAIAAGTFIVLLRRFA